MDRLKRIFSVLFLLVALAEFSFSSPAYAHGSESEIAERCRLAANAWLKSLDEEQTVLAHRPFDETERKTWHYLNSIPGVVQREQGVAFQDMTPEQRILGHRFVRCSLSSQGYSKAAGIMNHESIGWAVLADENDPNFDVGIRDAIAAGTVGTMGTFWLAVFGDPSKTDPWQWQLEGHHLLFNFTMVNGKIDVTPNFLGTRPTVIPSGDYAGWHVLGYEKDRAMRLMASLTDAQKKIAVIGDTAGGEIFTEPQRLHVFEKYTGLPASEMDANQKALFVEVIEEYIRNYEHEIADSRMKEITDTLDETYFMWIGPTDNRDLPIYFLIHGPQIVIEYANAINHGGNKGGIFDGEEHVVDPNHIHSIVTRPGKGWGDDLLREHYMNDPEHNPSAN